jgi:hypothetical protein
MAKQLYKISDFSGGMNNVQDPRDIKDNEMSFVKNFALDQRGALKTAGSLQASNYFDGVSGKELTIYLSTRTTEIEGGGGYSLFYFESDHGLGYSETVTGSSISFVAGGGGGATP